MENFKKHWEIKHNWQLLFPFFGILTLGYSAYKITNAFLKEYNIVFTVIASIVIFYLLLKL